MGGDLLKKRIRNKLKFNRELTNDEIMREKLKYEIASELGLKDKVDKLGWSSLTAGETGKIGGVMNKKKKELNMPKNTDILQK